MLEKLIKRPAKKKELTFEENYKILTYYQEEYTYRHKNFWKLLTSFLIFDVVISVLPLMTEIFGISLAIENDQYKILFPIFGIVIAVFSFLVLHGEAKRIDAVGKVKYAVARSFLPESHQYCKMKFKIKLRIGGFMAWAVLCVEVLISLGVLWVLRH